jgi:hypothetical protein
MGAKELRRQQALLVTGLMAATLAGAVWSMHRSLSDEPLRAEAAGVVPQAPAADAPARPAVKAIANKKLTAQPEPQRLIVTGAGFGPGMSARLITPDGLIISYEPTSIEQVGPTIFGLTVPLEKPGYYLLRVRSHADLISNDLGFEVGRPPAGAR